MDVLLSTRGRNQKCVQEIYKCNKLTEIFKIFREYASVLFMLVRKLYVIRGINTRNYKSVV